METELYMIETLKEVFGDHYDSSFVPFYINGWCGYEESSHVCLLVKDSQYFEVTWGYSVMAVDNTPEWYPTLIENEDKAIELMIEYDEIYADRGL